MKWNDTLGIPAMQYYSFVSLSHFAQTGLGMREFFEIPGGGERKHAIQNEFAK